MRLTLIRTDFYDYSTLGKLYIDDRLECVTLEDTYRPEGMKVDGATAIPDGTYEVKIDFSARFKRLMPHVLDVPGFSGIRIHSGNTDADTEGCILVGTEVVNSNFIGSSKLAFNELFAKMQTADEAGERITLEVKRQTEA